MTRTLHYDLRKFIQEKEMPLRVVYMPPGVEAKKGFHKHNFSEIVLILSGSGIHFFNGEQCPLKAGDVLIIHPEAVHGYDHCDLELVNIIFDVRQLILPILDGVSAPLFRKFFPDKQNGFYGQVEPILSLQQEEQKNIFEIIQRISDELKNCRPGHNLFCMALFIEIIITLCRLHLKNDQINNPPAQRIGETIEYMNTHYQQQISTAQLAKIACRSRRNFFLHFKNTVGCTPIQYLIRVRISRAMELLLYTEMSIGDIAARCGFFDSNYFCKTFRAQTGFSPLQYRHNKR